MRIEEFDYRLPAGLIAQCPVEERDRSRLMVLHRAGQRIEEGHFCDIVRYLRKGDLVIANDTKVFPARLIGRRETGGKTEVLLLRQLNGDNRWTCLIKGRRVRPDTKIIFDKRLRGVVEDRKDDTWILRLETDSHLNELLEDIGRMPLPPYIKRAGDEAEILDRERYQTIFALNRGAVAAPTAGLHFTERITAQLRDKGVVVETITLHVGWGTFKPVRVPDVRRHVLPPEEFRLKKEVVDLIREVKACKNRVVAVGTTVVRALEYALTDMDTPRLEGETSLFILPDYRFKIVDGLITNFHLPRSTLLMLVCAFGGKDFVLNAYRMAIEKGYRFYSYGDAMLIL